MSRSACTNRSSIVLMSFEKKPMASSFLFLVQRARSASCNRAFDQQRAARPGVPYGPPMPECHVADLGTWRTNLLPDLTPISQNKSPPREPPLESPQIANADERAVVERAAR